MTNQMSIASEPVFSFCVKSTRPEVTEEIINKCLVNIGTVHSIDFVEKHTTLPDDNSKHYKMAFIHLKKWTPYYENIAIRGAFLDKLQYGINIIYDNEGHYFTLHENYNPKYKTDTYIAYLEKQLNDANLSVNNYEEQLQIERANNMKYQSQNHELATMNQHLVSHNTILQQQIQWFTSQYVPATFSYSSNLNPYAQSYQHSKTE